MSKISEEWLRFQGMHQHLRAKSKALALANAVAPHSLPTFAGVCVELCWVLQPSCSATGLKGGTMNVLNESKRRNLCQIRPIAGAIAFAICATYPLETTKAEVFASWGFYQFRLSPSPAPKEIYPETFYPGPSSGVLPRAEIVRRAAATGLQPIAPPRRMEEVYVVVAKEKSGRLHRLVFDAYEGDLIDHILLKSTDRSGQAIMNRKGSSRPIQAKTPPRGEMSVPQTLAVTPLPPAHQVISQPSSTLTPSTSATEKPAMESEPQKPTDPAARPTPSGEDAK
jgi:hypothetical protein